MTYLNSDLEQQLKINQSKNFNNQGYKTPKMKRLDEIEKKLETIITNQKTGTSANKKESYEEVKNQDEDEEDDMEGMLKDLTAQILDKKEVKNNHIIRDFKLDQIQVDDKEHEYKNLLKSMGALYFANKYGHLIPILFNCWKEKYHEKSIEKRKQNADIHLEKMEEILNFNDDQIERRALSEQDIKEYMKSQEQY